MTLDELRGLDPKDIANWPLAGQAIALAALSLLLIFLGYYFVLSDQWDKLKASQAQEEQLKQTYLDKRRQVVNNAALEEQLKEIKKSFGTLIKQLPTKSQMDSLLSEINQAGTGRGLQVDLFKPGMETKTGEMAELPIDLKLTGTYEQLANFASDVGQLSRIVTLGNIVLNPIGDKGDRLTMQAVAKTYRALEPQEINAQKSGGAPAK
jgi:type IV pilus assembly protein PilO